MKKGWLVIFLGLLFLASYAQKQCNVWYFGQNAGVSFNTGSPVDISPSSMITQEGCASIADTNGQLLFYTDGSFVYDREHAQMPNGFNLKGDLSSTQSAIITPHPKKKGQYYIFTVRGCTSPSATPELNYSIVDMNLPGNGTIISPKGDIIAGSKNTFLTDSTDEKLTAIMRADSISYWVVVSKFFSTTFYAYHVSSSGVDPTPVISSFNTYTVFASCAGYMKASADGKTIVAAFGGYGMNDPNSSSLLMFDFDNCTGQLSNGKSISSLHVGRYGVEFSPNDSLIYASSQSQIHQYQRYAADVGSTETNVANLSGGGYCALQIASDGKIYFTHYTKNRLGSIDNPNKVSTPNITQTAISFAGTAKARLGLPNYFNIYLNGGFEFGIYNESNAICVGDSVTIGPDPLAGHQYLWSPGNSLNNPYISQPIATPSVTTIYTLSILNQCNDPIVDSVVVDVKNPPSGFLGNDKTICSDQSVILNATFPQSHYLWSPGNNTAAFITVSSPGSYAVTVTDSILGCHSFDSVHVFVNPLPIINLGNDTTICKEDFITLKASVPNITNYMWLPGNQTNSAITTSSEGSYIVKITDVNTCVNSDTINISQKDCPVSPFIPTSYTPNADGINDVFNVKAATDLNKFNLCIYNRWGEIIFNSYNQYTGWNGTSKNMPAEEGVYLYKYSASDNYGKNYEGTGKVVLLR